MSGSVLYLAPYMRKRFADKGYSVGKELGSGAFANVYECWRHVEATGDAPASDEPLVVKAINKLYVTTKQLKNEVKIALKLRHPNTCRMRHVFYADNMVYIIFERCFGGDLNAYRKSLSPPQLSEDETRLVAKQTAEAVKYLHNGLGIAHRDIKPSNILLVDTTPAGGVKLADFGMSTVVWDNDHNRPLLSATYCGTKHFRSPELLREQEPYDAKAVDCWAFGATIFVLMTGQLPYDVTTRGKFTPEYHKLLPDLSDGLRDLLGKLLEEDPSKRLTIEEVVSHPWVSAGASH